MVSGGLFFATAIWGVTDAILNFQPEVLIPADEPAPAAGAPRAGAGRACALGLYLDRRRALGGGLAFRF